MPTWTGIGLSVSTLGKLKKTKAENWFQTKWYTYLTNSVRWSIFHSWFSNRIIRIARYSHHIIINDIPLTVRTNDWIHHDLIVTMLYNDEIVSSSSLQYSCSQPVAIQYDAPNEISRNHRIFLVEITGSSLCFLIPMFPGLLVSRYLCVPVRVRVRVKVSVRVEWKDRFSETYRA